MAAQSVTWVFFQMLKKKKIMYYSHSVKSRKDDYILHIILMYNKGRKMWLKGTGKLNVGNAAN